MPELRQDQVTGWWVVVAKERAKRPDDFIRRGRAAPPTCPFEYGHESMTPPETLAFRPDNSAANTPGWIVRVVPNKFPAFTPENHAEVVDGLYRRRTAYGVHEVVVHGPEHDLSLATYPDEQVAEVLRAYKLRYEYHKRQPYTRYVQIIINHGKEAGASLEHSHSQLFAIPLIPELPKIQLKGAADYFYQNNRCIYCDIIASEIAEGARMIDQSEHFIAFVPYAAKLPFETWITPLQHKSQFETISDSERIDLASMLRRTLKRFYNGLDNPPYNMYLHTSPPGYDLTDAYHWHMSITPKLTIQAGFEMGTGMTINVTIPEDSAKFLRGVQHIEHGN
ncbi:MAG: galactose-1-phosphate uridylyltransferase [Actinobacteria bacterium]|nr:galactose-1-phosphate uridylyltransferase [Actinomycetota bacterium]